MIFIKNNEPNYIFDEEENRFFVTKSVKYDSVKDDGLSLGYPADSGDFSVVDYQAVSDEINTQCLVLRETMYEFIEPRTQCDPRFQRFVKYVTDEDDFDSSDCCLNAIAEMTERCRSFLLDGAAQLVHEFYWNGDKLYRVAQDIGDDFYFVSVKDPHDKSLLDYDMLMPVMGIDDINDAIAFAINDDKSRQKAKEAKTELNRQLMLARKELMKTANSTV